jgi:hypothetical protein
MKSLRYLNAVLSVIAACLVILTLQNLHVIPDAKAGTSGSATPNYALVPLSADGTVEVKVRSFEEELKVDLRSIAGSTCYQGIPVVVKK